MTTALASATVIRGDERHDVAVPMGTTVAGLLAMLHIDTSVADLVVTRTDGVRVGLDEALGRELPTGAVLACSDEQLHVRSTTVRGGSVTESWVTPAIVALSTVSLVLVGEILVFWLPEVMQTPLPGVVRAIAGLIFAGMLVSLVRWPTVVDSPWGAVLVPPLLGVAVGGGLVLAGEPGLSGRITVVACAVAIAAGLLWWWRSSITNAVAALCWIATAAVVAISVAVAAHLPSVALACGGLVVAGLSLLPDHALRLPSSQLLNFPYLAMRENSVRAPIMAEPEPIEGRRVRRTLADAEAVLATGSWWGVLIVVATLPLSLRTLGEQDRWFAVGAFVAMTVALALLPRQHPSHQVQILPRLGAVCVGVSCAWTLARLTGAPELAFAGGLVFAGFLVPLTVALITGREKSAYVGYMAEVWQRMSLVAVVPLALIGAHMIDYVWRAAS